MGSNSDTTVCQVDDLAAARPRLALKKAAARLSRRGACPQIVDRYQDLALFAIQIVLRDFPILPSTAVMSAPHAPAHEAARDRQPRNDHRPEMPEFRTRGLHTSRFGRIDCGEHGAVLFAVSNNGLVQSGPNVEPERGSVRRLHAICFEVESNLIRLLRLMPRRTVKSGTAEERAGTVAEPDVKRGAWRALLLSERTKSVEHAFRDPLGRSRLESSATSSQIAIDMSDHADKVEANGGATSDQSLNYLKDGHAAEFVRTFLA